MRRIGALLFAAAGACWGLTPYQSKSFVGNPADWSGYHYNGSLTQSGNALTTGTSGSLIFGDDSRTQSEVRSNIRYTQVGGSYWTYIRASSDALFNVAGGYIQGTFYAIEVNCSNPGSQYVAMWKSVAGSVSALSSAQYVCHDNMDVRVVLRNGWWILGYLDGNHLLYSSDLSIASGRSGTGVSVAPGGNGISSLQMADIETIQPPQPSLGKRPAKAVLTLLSSAKLGHALVGEAITYIG